MKTMEDFEKEARAMMDNELKNSLSILIRDGSRMARKVNPNNPEQEEAIMLRLKELETLIGVARSELMRRANLFLG